MALPSIKDQSIVDAVKARFEAITAGSNYYTTFSNVYDNLAGGAASIPDAETKVINLRDTSDSLNVNTLNGGSDIQNIDLDLDIDVIAKDAAATDIRKMKADILKSIGSDVTWGGLAFNTLYRGMQRNKVDQYGNIVADLTITVTIIFRKTAFSVNTNF